MPSSRNTEGFMDKVLNYPGAKWGLAKKFIQYIPKHHSYLEPYFGSGAVFFRKEPSRIETINDLDGNVTNLFDCIRTEPERLRQVQIENRPALEVMERFDSGNVFMYLDPPYVLDTRTRKQYLYEMTDADHENLLEFVLSSKAKIMISGYENGLYQKYLAGWKKVSFSAKSAYGAKRTEVIWMNY